MALRPGAGPLVVGDHVVFVFQELNFNLLVCVVLRVIFGLFVSADLHVGVLFLDLLLD